MGKILAKREDRNKKHAKLNSKGKNFIKAMHILVFVSLLIWFVYQFGSGEVRSNDGEVVYEKVTIKTAIKNALALQSEDIK